jgi:hypothetical protein
MRKIVIIFVLSAGLLFAGCKTSISGTSPTVVTGTTSTTISSVISTTIVATSIFTGSPPLNAPVSVDANSDGQTVNVNLVKFTGIIPSSASRVLVDNNPITVDTAGN